MKTREKCRWLSVAALLCSLSLPLAVQGAQSQGAGPASTSDTADVSADALPSQKIGAPQILEIPPQPVSPPEAATPPPPIVREEVPQRDEPSLREQPTEPSSPPAPRVANRRNYLGVLYATAEEGANGVKVLDVVPGSPAERAGFHGANRPSEGQSNLIKAAIVVLAMSPAGPFAIPLAIAHDMYMNHQSPGDVIVAVGDRPVRDAQEFSDAMRRYQPHDTVSFSVLRGGKSVQLSVQLEEEPS